MSLPHDLVRVFEIQARRDPLWDALLSGRIAEFKDLAAERKKANHARTAPSDEPLGWVADDRKLVRLDHAIMACHLMTARVSLRSLAAIKRQKVHALRNWILGKVALFIASKLGAGGTLGFPNPVSVVADIMKFVRLDGIELEAELAIRRQGIRVQRELREVILFKNSHRVRKVKRVFTRNGPAVPQRAPNKNWTSPKA